MCGRGGAPDWAEVASGLRVERASESQVSRSKREADDAGGSEKGARRRDRWCGSGCKCHRPSHGRTR